MTAEFVKKLDPNTSAPGAKGTTPGDVLLSGNGDTLSWVPFRSLDSAVRSGIWESQTFSKKKSHPDEMEFCYIISGSLKLHDTKGNFSEFSAGDAFVVEPGFDGVWESVTPVRKFFVVAKCQ